MMRPLACTLMLASVAACRGTPPAVAPEPAGTCRAEAARSLIGAAFDDATGVRARDAAGARSVRAVRPGEAVTMDFRPDRLTIDLDEAGHITALRCG